MNAKKRKARGPLISILKKSVLIGDTCPDALFRHVQRKPCQVFPDNCRRVFPDRQESESVPISHPFCWLIPVGRSAVLANIIQSTACPPSMSDNEEVRMAKGNRKWVKFEFRADPKSKVYIAGTFNDWNDKQMKLKETGDGNFSTSLVLCQGRHEYKFIVNGIWCADPSCQEWVPNAHGSLNSVITVA